MRYVVEPMRLEDLPQVQEIERESFPSTWPTNVYRRELTDNKIAHYLVARLADNVGQPERNNNDAGSFAPVSGAAEAHDSVTGKTSSPWERLVSNIKQRLSPTPTLESPAQTRLILGFAGLWFMVNEAHLTTIAVRKDYRRQGIGELLLISAIELAAQRGADVVTLEVRASNISAQALYEKYGFTNVGRRPGYYSDTPEREDAIIMTTDSITSAPYQAMFQRLKRAYAERWK